MELLGKLEIKDTLNIGILTSASKDVSIKFSEQCLHILSNNDLLNGLRGNEKIQKRELLFKYQPHFYNILSNDGVKHIDMKLLWRNKLFTSLNEINGKPAPYESKGLLIHYHYISDTKLCPCIFYIIRITCSGHTCAILPK